MTRSKTTVSKTPVRKTKSKKKTPPKTIHPRRQAKSVLVDVIEDEPSDSDLSWLAENDQLLVKNSDFRKKKNTSHSKMPPKKFVEHEITKKKVSHSSENAKEIDSQKKFFENLAQEIKTEDPLTRKNNQSPQKTGRSVVLYRRLVLKFIVLIGIVAAVVIYFSFSKLTVTLNLKGEKINDSLLLKVVATPASTSAQANSPHPSSTAIFNTNNLKAQNDPREIIKGSIKKINVQVSKTYPANGETFLGNKIIGRVEIINNYTSNQPLVATTRLLSPDNKLFRIVRSVNVPAGGRVAVNIYTKHPSPSMAIGVTRFIIPGLWAGLQDKIYARSLAPFTYTQEIRKYVNASDLAYAAQDINRLLIMKAKVQAKAKVQSEQSSSATKWLYIVNNPPVVTINAKAGDRQDQFTAQAQGQIVAVNFSRSAVAKLAIAKLNLAIPADKELVNFNPAHIVYSLISYDPASESATIKASFTGTMILKNNSDLISPKSLINLSKSQIKTYLSNQPEVDSYQLKFSPTFIKRAPSLVDRIKININKN